MHCAFVLSPYQISFQRQVSLFIFPYAARFATVSSMRVISWVSRMKVADFQMLRGATKPSPLCPVTAGLFPVVSSLSSSRPLCSQLSAGPAGFVNWYTLLLLPETYLPPSVPWKILASFKLQFKHFLFCEAFFYPLQPQKTWLHPSVFHPYVRPGCYYRSYHTEIQLFIFASAPGPVLPS